MKRVLALFAVVLAAIVGGLVYSSASSATTSCTNGSGTQNEYQTGYFRDHHVPVLGSSMQDVLGLGALNVYSGFDVAYISVADPYDHQSTWMQAGISADTSNVEHPYIEVYDGNTRVKHTVYSTVLNKNQQYTFTIDHFAGGDYHAVVPGGNTYTYSFNQSPREQDAQAEIQNPSTACNLFNAAYWPLSWGSTCSGSCQQVDGGDPNPYIISNYDNGTGFNVVGP